MGELWANMDKIDIREERRNREETRKKIEKLHGSKKEGMDGMKKKKWVIAGSGIVILLVFAAVWILFLKKPKEIDQKILFIYRQEHYGCFSRGPDKGYYIDNRGNKVEYDLDAILGKGDWDREMDRVVEILNTMQVTESTPVFSERKLARLYRYLYRIDIEAEKEMTLEGNRHAFGNYRLYAVRYQENGEPEIIKLFEAGYRYGVNPDPYAQKIKTALLRENPIWAY